MTKIQLTGDIKGFLNLKEDTACPITFSVADIKDITKKKGAFSKSITLVGDKNNNRLLGNIFDVNVSQGTFNINKIVECNILQNEVPILENGIFQLVSINKIQNDKYEDEITYTCLVKDNIGDFFTQINNKELTDLSGFEYMKHIYTADNVINSFNNTIIDGYKYIMPYTPEGQDVLNDATLDLTEFSPGIYTKIYFDKIFQEAGYSYRWEGMDDSDVNFSKLIIPFNGEKPIIKGIEDLDYTSEVENSVSQTISTRTQSNYYNNRYQINQSTTDRVNMPVIISNISGNWNTLFSVYTPPNLPSNQNSIEIEYDLEWELVVNSFGTSYLKNYNTSSLFDFSVIPSIKIRRQNTSQILISTNILDNGEIMKFEDGDSFSSGVSVLKSGTISFTQLVPEIDPNYGIEVASNVAVSSGWMFKATNNINGTDKTSTSFGFRITSIRAKIKTLVEGEYGYNVPVDIKKYIPQKIKQSDFIKSILTMFNLFVDVDKENPKQLNLISRDKYYDSGNIKDWTRKMVKNKPQEVKFIPEVSSKSIILTYKEDSDISNKIYKEASGEIYGQQKFIFDNEFVREEKKQEITFSPTPMFNTSFGAVCPMWLGGSPKCNLRILYDGGEYDCNSYNIVNYRLSSGTINQVSTTKYPYISHWDKPTNPTFDLNFGVCSYYFRSDNFGSLTNNNLFNLHWRRTFNQINTGKIMTCDFILNETDIYNLKLNDKICIDNSWWNINKVQDYDGNSNKSTKVELISIDDNLYIPFQTRNITRFDNLSNDIIATPIRSISKERDKFLTVNLSPYDIEVRGKYNYITNDVTSATIVGDGNLVSANSQVYGNNNIIAAESTVTGYNNIVEEDGVGSVVNGNEIIVTEPNSENNIPNENYVIHYNITRSEAETLQLNNGFVVGSQYTITNADVGLYGGTEVTLIAITTNKLSLQGSGKFYCPKYDLSVVNNGYGMWTKYMDGTFGTITGTFTTNEIVTANNGATAKFLTIGFLEWISGNWSSVTSITGGTSGATCTVSGFVSPSYSIGDIVHWGGKSWTNVNGNVGNSIDDFTLDTEWSEIPFNDTDYNVFIDEIHYDFERDRIIYRKDSYGNEIESIYDTSTNIKRFKWGCFFNGIFDYGIFKNKISDGYINCINTLGRIYDNTLNGGFIEDNILSKNSFIVINSIDNGSINGNILNNSGISENIVKYSVINNNSLFNGSTIDINNINYGNIYDNILVSNGSINGNNINYGNIHSNSVNNSEVINNTLNNQSVINNNSISGGGNIGYNILDNQSNISSNTLNIVSKVQYNTLNNSRFTFSNISTNIQNCQANRFNASGTNISLSGATIIGSIYSKDLFSRQDGTNRLSYVNNSDVRIITNVNA